MLALQGASLPVNFGAYPVVRNGVEGHVISVDGKSAFFAKAACDLIGEYFRPDRDSETEPVDIIAPFDPAL